MRLNEIKNFKGEEAIFQKDGKILGEIDGSNLKNVSVEMTNVLGIPVVKMTTAEFEALENKDDNIIYILTDEGQNNIITNNDNIIYYISEADTPEVNGGYWYEGYYENESGEKCLLYSNGNCYLKGEPRNSAFYNATWYIETIEEGDALYTSNGALNNATMGDWLNVNDLSPAPFSIKIKSALYFLIEADRDLDINSNTIYANTPVVLKKYNGSNFVSSYVADGYEPLEFGLIYENGETKFYLNGESLFTAYNDNNYHFHGIFNHTNEEDGTTFTFTPVLYDLSSTNN